MDFIDHRSTAQFTFLTSATDEKIRINTSGDLLVGISTPFDTSGITLDATGALGVDGHITVATGATYDIGTAINKFRDLYLSGDINVAGVSTSGNLTVGGSLSVTTDATITNDLTVSNDATVSGDLTVSTNAVIAGDLTVNGTTTTINTETLDVKDKNITLNYGGDTTSADGAGITIEDAVSAGTDATILWDGSSDTFDFSHAIDVTGTISGDNTLSIQNSTAYGAIEVGGVSGGFIDIKSPFSDDYDLRLISEGSGGVINVASGELTIQRAGSAKLATTSTGIAVTGNATFADNGKAIFGAGSDLSIYHDANDSYISDQGSGNLKLLTDEFRLRNAADSAHMLTGSQGGAITAYHNGNARLATTSTGIDVTGVTDTDGITSSAEIDVNLAAAGKYFEGGSGGVRRLSITSGTNTSEHAKHTFDIASGNGKYVFAVNSSDKLSVDSSGITVESGGTNIGIVTKSTDQYAFIGFEDNTSSASSVYVGADGNDFIIRANSLTRFRAASNGDVSLYEDTGTTAKFFWDASTERLGIGNTAPATALDVTGTVTADGLTVDGGANLLTRTSSGAEVDVLEVRNNATATSTASTIKFVNSTAAGSNSGSSELVAVRTGTNTGEFKIRTSNSSAAMQDIVTVDSSGIDVTGTVDVDGLNVEITDNQASPVTMQQGGNSYFKIVTTNGSESVQLGNSTTNPDILLGGGYAGLGTSSPAAKLDIVDTSADVQMRVYKNDGTKNTRVTLTADDSGAKIHYRDADNAGALRFNNNLGEVMRITANTTRLGIGTTNPDGTLHISGTGTAPAKLIWERSDGGVSSKNWTAYIDNTHDLLFGKTDDSGTLTHDYLHIQDNGNVGVNVSVPTYKLNVLADSGSQNIFQAGQSGVSNGFSITSDGSALTYSFLTGNVGIGLSSGLIAKMHVKGAGTSSSTNAIFAENSSSAGIFAIRDNGNAFILGDTGIGTSSAEKRLHIFDSTQTNQTIRFGNPAATPLADINYDSSGFEHLYISVKGTTTGYGNIVFSTGPTPSEAMRLDASGNLVVGGSSAYAQGATTIANGGILYVSRNGGSPATFRRNSDEGNLITLEKDGSTVGSLGVDNTDNLTISGNSTHAGLNFSTAAVLPYKNGSYANGTIDLGEATSAKWKDLHMSGTANVGSVISSGQIKVTGSNASGVAFSVGDAGTGWYNTGSNSIGLATAGSERARFTSIGTFLVGKTAEDNSTVGIRMNSTGDASFVADGHRSLVLNRKTSDGDLAVFLKDNTTVGSVGTIFGDLYVGTGDTMLRFDDSNDALTPRGSGGSARDNAISLGSSSVRFKDLYLSAAVRWYSGSTQKAYLQYSSGDDDVIHYAGSGVGYQFWAGGSERTRLDGSGNQLWGKTSADNTTQGIRFLGSSGFMSVVRSNDTLAIFNRIDGDGTLLEFRTSGTTRGSISISGSTTSYNTTSDERAKENIVDAPSASADIDAIRVRSFDFKADGSHQKYGMVAQELGTVAPEAVTVPDDAEEMQSVDYSKLVPMLVKEIQSLRARVAQLEGEN